MERRRIEGTRHVRRRMKPGARIAIAALSIALVAVAGILICKKLDPDKYSLKAVASRVESVFKGAAPEGSVVAINTSATTKPDGTPMGYVSGGGTLINRATGGGNTLTLTASESGDNLFNGWTVNGTRIGSMDTTLKVCINTSAHDKQYYDSTTKTLYVTDTADIKAVYIAPLMAPSNSANSVGNSLGLFITPNTGHCWIPNLPGSPDSWDGYITIPSGQGGNKAQLILQYVDGDSARAYVYDNNMKQISVFTGHRSDTKDLLVDFIIPTVSEWTTIYCVPRLNQTDNSCFAIFESNPADAGSCGGTMTSGNSPFTTQLQATPNKGYKLKDWTVVFDGDKKTLTDKNPSVYINGTYKIIANFEEAYYDVKLAKTEPSDGGSVTGLDKYKEGSSPEISITCNDGYELDNWSYTTTDGIVHSGTTKKFTIPNIKEDIGLYVTFKSDKKRVEVKSSPASGGSVTIQNKTTETAAKSDYEEFVIGQSATITATPGEGYKFIYWKDSAGTQIPYSTTSFSVTSDNSYTAYFVKSTINVKTAVTPDGKGGVKLDYKDKDGTSKTSTELGDHSDVQSNTEITLTGIDAESGYHFAEFVDSKGNHHIPATVGSKSVTIGGAELLEDETYTALFVPEQARITVNSVPEIVGSVIKIGDDEVTSKEVAYDASMTLSAEASGYKVRYWKDQNGTIIKPGDSGCSADGKTLDIVAKYGDRAYTVYFVEDKYDLAVNISPAGAGKYVLGSDPSIDSTEYTSGHVYTGVPSVANYTINATENPGYKVDRYVDEDGNTLEKNGSGYGEINALDKNKQVTIYFIEEAFDVSAQADPVTSGSVKVNGHYGTDKVRTGTKAVLEATPVHGYLFKGWYKAPGGAGGDKVSDDNPYTIDPVRANTELYAHFEKEKVSVTIGLSKPGTGSVRLNGREPVTVDTTYEIAGSSTITVEAYPNGGGLFNKWMDSKSGNTYTDNPLTIVDVSKDMTLMADFTATKYNITPAVNIAGAGTATVTTSMISSSPSAVEVSGGEKVVLRATPAAGYTFLYWTSSDGTQYDGRRGLDGGSTLTIDQVYKTDTYTAHFVKKDLTILLESSPAGVGMVRLGNNPYEDDKVQYTVDGNSSIQIFAEPKDPSKYEFERWENKNKSSEVYKANPTTIVSVGDTMHYVAVFVPKNLGIRTVASPASGGKVTKTINDDGSVTITASANRGYSFANWKKGDKLLTTGVKYVIDAEDVKDGDVYTAYFKTNKDYDAKSDITKENFYREWRKVYDPSYKVTRETMQQQARFVVSNLRQYNDATPPLRNFAAFAEAREYYESLLSDADIKRMRGRFGDSELITAEGEVLKPDLLPDYEVYEDKAEAFTLKKFGDRYDTEILTVKRVYEPEDFNNINRTYLWRYTGAQFKDNIYLLYHIDGKEEAWATPIVDEDDVIKFTLDELPDNDVLAVVRVKIK